MSTLRSKIIRLAHEKPELREHLLPLLKQAAQVLTTEHEMMKLYRNLPEKPKAIFWRILADSGVEQWFDRGSNFSVGGKVYLGGHVFKSQGYASVGGQGVLDLEWFGWKS